MVNDDATTQTPGSRTADATEAPSQATDIPEGSADQSVTGITSPAGPEAGQEVQEQSYSFSHLANGEPSASETNIDFILDIPLEVVIELGRTKLLIHELLTLGQGSVIQLSKLAGETLDILANQRLVARGEVVVVDEKYGIRLTEIVSPKERIESLK